MNTEAQVPMLAIADPDQGEFDVRYFMVGWLERKLEKLNKRAAKIGANPVSVQWLRCYTYTWKDEITGQKHRERYQVAKLVGEPVKFEGWSMLGAIDYLPGGEVLFGDVPESFRGRGCVCDHCGKKRIRNKTVVVRHEDGRELQVGASCVRDFLGHDPKVFMFWAKQGFKLKKELADVDEETEAVERERFGIDVRDYVAHVAKAIRLGGYHKSDELYPTKDHALNLLRSRETEDHAEDQDFAKADQAIEWATGMDADSTYLRNLQVAVTSRAIHDRVAGIVASIFVAWNNARGIKAEKKGPVVKSEHVAPVGERIEAKVQVRFHRHLESDWGVTTLCKFADEDGRLLTWFASKAIDFEPGETITVRGTVKAHNEFQGVKETVLTRCKIIE